MSRWSILSLGLLLAASACDFDLGLGDEPLFSCDAPLLPGECVDEDNPLAFTAGVEGLAIGAETQVSVLVHESLTRYTVRSTDPDVVEAELDGGGNVIVTGRAAGEARIQAIAGETGRVLDSLPIEVAVVARTDFFYYPGSGDPLAELAGVVGGSDVVHAVHRSARGTALVADGAIDYAVEGPLSLGGETEPRVSDLIRAFSGELDGRAIAVSFDEAGAGRLIARGADGGEVSLPIRAVAAADRHRIEPSAELALDARSLLLLRSTAEDGVIVAGVRGAWSVADPDRAELTTQDDLASEAAIQPKRRGTLTVQGDLGDAVVTQDFRVDD
jgi:hypothetical protein